jgi:hypothetical protein
MVRIKYDDLVILSQELSERRDELTRCLSNTDDTIRHLENALSSELTRSYVERYNIVRPEIYNATLLLGDMSANLEALSNTLKDLTAL